MWAGFPLPVSLPSNKNSLYGQSATKWLLACVNQSINYQAVYIPFFLFKCAGDKGISTILKGVFAINNSVVSQQPTPLAQSTETHWHIAVLGWGCLG